MPVPRELQHVYDEHAEALFAFLLNLTRDEADTRDCLQDVFVRLARHPSLLAGAGNTRAFLLRVAHNHAVDMIRRRATRDKLHRASSEERVELFAVTDDPDEMECRERLAAALGELPPEQRAVVHLKLWEGLTFEQIARMLEIPPNTAASRYRYGLDKLRNLLRPLYEELT